jgi:FMN phosphatase YigB (HAD superfamily)
LAKELGAKVETVLMETSLEDCIHRDFNRQESVGRHVIIGMAMQNGLYQKPEKGIVICDIDGTLADINHRRHFVVKEPKDHKSFFAAISMDKPRFEVYEQVMKFREEGYEIFLVSGRPEEYRKETWDWLNAHFLNMFYKALFMRPAGDHRPDSEVKQEIYNRYFKNYSIYKVIDDRPRVIRMWQENGLEVIDVGDGIEF